MELGAWVGWLYKHIAWADTFTTHHLSLRLNYLLTKGAILWLTLENRNGAMKILLDRYSNMHSEKSSPVLIVILAPITC